MHLTLNSRLFNTTSVVGGIIMVVYAISTLITTLKLQEASHDHELEEISKNLQAHQHYIERIFEHGFDEIESIRTITREAQGEGVASRQLINKILKSRTFHNKEFLGFWMVWEPDAFDGKDQVTKEGQGTNAEGRFVPYWHWDGDSVVVESCVLFDVQDYYQLPKKHHKGYLLEPFVYPVGGKDSLLVSVVVPIMDEGRFKGVVGADLSMNALADLVNRVGDIEEGSAFLRSGEGTYVVHHLSEFVGFTDTTSGSLTSILGVIPASPVKVDDLGDEVRLSIQLANDYAQVPWDLTLIVPEISLNQDFISIRSNLLVLSAISALIIGFLLAFNVTQRIVSDEERIKVRSELSMADARLTSYIEGGADVPSSVYSVDHNFCYTGFNSIHKREMKDHFRSDVENGKYMPDLVPDSMRANLLRNFKRAMKGEQFSVTNMYQQGYFTQTFNPVFDEKTRIIGLTSSVVDVTSRVKADQELEQYRDQLEEIVEKRTHELTAQKEFFQKIIDEIPAIIFVRNAVGNYILVNQLAADSFGMPIDDIIGKSVLDTHHDREAAEHFLIEDADLIKNGGLYQNETLFTWPPDKSKKWLFLAKSRIYLNKEPHILGIHVDVTHLKETEMKLKGANSELQSILEDLKSTQLRLIESEKMASIGQLSAGLAHEINNPINYVAGNLHPIKRDLREIKHLISEVAGKWGEEGAHLLETVEEMFHEIENLMAGVDEGTNRVSGLIGDLRAFARPGENGGRGPLNLNECIESTVNLVRHQPGKRIQFVVNRKELPLVNGTDQQFKQVCLNLLTNACQAIEKEGTVTIEAEVLKDQVRLLFSDTGSGISEENLGRVFEPFFTTKDVGEGTGLGLAISYNLIKDLGGEIGILSTSSKGTTFELKLPILV